MSNTDWLGEPIITPPKREDVLDCIEAFKSHHEDIEAARTIAGLNPMPADFVYGIKHSDEYRAIESGLEPYLTPSMSNVVFSSDDAINAFLDMEIEDLDRYHFVTSSSDEAVQYQFIGRAALYNRKCYERRTIGGWSFRFTGQMRVGHYEPHIYEFIVFGNKYLKDLAKRKG